MGDAMPMTEAPIPGIDGIPPSYVRDSFPALAKLVAAVDAEEAVQSWKAKHPDAYGEK